MTLNTGIDVLIVNLPPFESNAVPGAPAVLKGIANSVGLKTKVVDFNLNWIDVCTNQGLDRRSCLVGISVFDIPNSTVKTLALEQIDRWANQVCELSPNMLAISVFSYYSQFFCYHLSKQVSKLNKNIKIVIGGAGVKTALHETPVFGDFLKSNNLIDEYLLGDAEQCWLAYISKQFDLGPIASGDVFLMPEYVPDFSDFEFERYQRNVDRFTDTYIANKVIVPLTSSVGCVRKCDFCEIHRYWRFQQKSTRQITQEIRSILSLLPDGHVEFTDSLINGSVTGFSKLLDSMVEIKKEFPDFTWASQAIVRTPTTCPEEIYEKMANTGLVSLQIGVETGSDRLREVMNKGFNNTDLDFMLEMMYKYELQCIILQFLGHPEETEEDFRLTMDMYRRYQKYAGNPIKKVQLNYLMVVQKNTPIYDKREQLGLYLSMDPGLWYCKSNPELTLDERVRRRFILSELLDELGYEKASDDKLEMDEMAIVYAKYDYARDLIERRNMYLDISIESTLARGKSFSINIIKNGEPVKSTRFLVADPDIVEIVATGKDQFDTVVDATGNILEDVSLRITKITLAGVDFTNRSDMFEVADLRGNKLSSPASLYQDGKITININDLVHSYFDTTNVPTLTLQEIAHKVLGRSTSAKNTTG